MKKRSVVIIVISLILIVSCAHAIEWDYDQVVGFIDSIAIDGKTMFSEKTQATFGGPDPNNFFTMKGAVLFWFADTNHGELWLFNKDEKNICMWQKAEKQYYSSIMQVLVPILSDYIDYKNGGKITFIITSENSFTKPFIQLEYSTVPDKNGTVYTDPEEYCNVVKKTVENTILSE